MLLRLCCRDYAGDANRRQSAMNWPEIGYEGCQAIAGRTLVNERQIPDGGCLLGRRQALQDSIVIYGVGGDIRLCRSYDEPDKE